MTEIEPIPVNLNINTPCILFECYPSWNYTNKTVVNIDLIKPDFNINEVIMYKMVDRHLMTCEEGKNEAIRIAEVNGIDIVYEKYM